MFIKYSIPPAIAFVTDTTTGSINEKDRTQIIPPRIPSEKLSTIISKPLGTLSLTKSSNFLITKPENGPIIIAPKNIGISAPTTIPKVPIAPATAPLFPCTNPPPL